MAEPLLINFPYRDVLISSGPFSRELLESIEPRVLKGEASEGYLYLERDGSCDFLIFYRKQMHSAVRWQQDSYTSVTLADFFTDLARRPPKRLRFCRTDVGLILLMAVVVQNTPTLKVTGGVADLDRVLADLKDRGKPAGILISRGRDQNVVYCRDGDPAAIYFGNPSDNPPDESVRDKTLAYGYTAPEETTIEIFHNLQSRKDENAARRFADLLEGEHGPPPFFLKVTHGKKTVLRRLIQNGEAHIGRDPVNDIVLDHQTVSRKHCSINWNPGGFMVRDAGSSNQTLVNNVVAETRALKSGDEITVGDFHIVFSDEEEAEPVNELQTLFLDRVPTGSRSAQIIFDGVPIPLQSAVFTIGKGAEASLRLTGMFMRPIQATVIRDTDGVYRLFGTSGGKSVSVNGERIRGSGLELESGAQISIGKHRITFVLT